MKKTPYGPPGFGTLTPRFPDPMVYCSTCGNQAALQLCRVVSKREGTWRCNKCRVKITTLFRGFGVWPSESFDRLSPALKQQFFKDIADKNSSDTVAFAKAQLMKFEQHERFYEEKGCFLPLSVWATKGFNTADIEAKTPECDKQVHDILGLCYRVALLATGRHGAEGHRHEDTAGGRGRKRSSAAALAGQDADADGDEGEQGKTSSSSTDSSSSSSSSAKKRGSKKSKKVKSEKKGAKHKKGKKDKKKRKKADKAREDVKLKKQKEREAKRTAAADQKMQQKAIKAKETLANQAKAKLTAAKVKMETTLCQPSLIGAPADFVTTAKIAYERLKVMIQECNNVLANPSENDLSFESIKEVSKTIAEAKNAETLIATVVKQMEHMRPA